MTCNKKLWCIHLDQFQRSNRRFNAQKGCLPVLRMNPLAIVEWGYFSVTPAAEVLLQVSSTRASLYNLPIVAIGLVLGLKQKVVGDWSENHFTYLDPIGAERGHEESFEVVATHRVGWRSLVHLLWEDFQQTHRDITMQEGQPLQQESSGIVDPLLIRTPMFEAVPDKRLQNVQSLRRRNVNVSLFFDFSGQPRLDESTATKHGRLRQVGVAENFFFVF